MNKINFQNGTLVAKAKVTINGTVYEVEPAEYEGTTPLNAENLNQIQTNAENAINTVQSNLNTTDQNIEDLTTYSTEEKVVGTWIDGKPIYRRIYYGTRNESDEVHFHFPVGFDTWKDVIKLNGSVNLFNGSTAPIPATFLSQSTINVIPLMILGRESDWNPNSFYITPSNTNDKVKDYIIIFEYTKTTD